MPAEWSAVGAGLFCPVAVSPAPGRVVLLARTAAGELVRRERSPDGGWGRSRSLGVPIARSAGGGMDVPVDWQLAACGGGSGSDGADGLEVVARSPDGDLLHHRLHGGGRPRFECLGAPAAVMGGRAIPLGIASAPAVCRGAPERLDVFAVGQSGELLHAVRSDGEWAPFDALGVPDGAPPLEAVAACACGPASMAVFRRGGAGDLLLKWWDGAAWSRYASLGSPQVPDPSYPAVLAPAPLTGPPAACSWGPSRLDVFARGSAGDLVHAWWDGSDWSSFESLGLPVAAAGQAVPLTGAVSACSAGEGACDVLAGAVDGRLYHAVWSEDA